MKTANVFNRAISIVADNRQIEVVENLNRKIKKRDTRIESLIAAQSQSTQYILELKLGIIELEVALKRANKQLEKNSVI